MDEKREPTTKCTHEAVHTRQLSHPTHCILTKTSHCLPVVTMASNQTLEHPALGPIIGVDSGPCIQYKGVPYATLEHQLADAVLFENPSKQSIDATHYG